MATHSPPRLSSNQSANPMNSNYSNPPFGVDTQDTSYYQNINPYLNSRSRFNTMESILGDADDPTLSRYRGLCFLMLTGICFLSFIVGLFFAPLVVVTALPHSSMTTVVEKSLWRIILGKWDNKEYPAAASSMAFCILLPILQMLGTLVIIFDNFFAKGFERPPYFTAKTRNSIVEYLCMGSSYQAVIFFMPLLFVCFFTTGVTLVSPGLGFYFYLAYCLISIVMLQFVEIWKEPPPDENEEEEYQKTGVESSHALRRRITSWIPPLPGLSRQVTVDTNHVMMLLALFLVLICIGFFQPLLEVHIAYLGLTFERKTLTLLDVRHTLNVTDNLLLRIFFEASVVWIPATYALLLTIAGLSNLDIWRDKFKFEVPHQIFDYSVMVAAALRPWAMTDVFAISLAIFLWSCQADYLVTSIPSGVLAFSPDEDAQVVLIPWLSGIYMALGAGIAMFYLRWFWVGAPAAPAGYSSTGLRANSVDDDVLRSVTGMSYFEKDAKNRKEASYLPKIIQCVMWWIIICVVVQFMPYKLHKFKVEEVNTVLNKTVPYIHGFVSKDLPASYGDCKHPDVPQRCKENGVLYQTMQDTKRISVLWVSGLNTLDISEMWMNTSRYQGDIGHSSNSERRMEDVDAANKSEDSEHRNETDRGVAKSKDSKRQKKNERGVAKSKDSDSQAEREVVVAKSKESGERQYKLTIKGQLKRLNFFLKVELCQDTKGNGCQVFLETNSSCCKPHRHFNIEIDMRCEDKLPILDVSKFSLGTLVVQATKDMSMEGTSVMIGLPAQDITSQVADTVKSELVQYLTKEKLLNWGKQELNFQQLVAKILKFSAKDKGFMC